MKLATYRFAGKVILSAVLISATLIGHAIAAPGGVSDGLMVWLRAASGVTSADGGAVEIWIDESGQGNSAVFNQSNPYGEQPPIFDASNPAANDKATVRFANTNALELDLTWLAGSDYTIFVVNGRDRTGLANFYIAGDAFAQDQNLVLGYEQVGLLRQAHFSRDLDAIVPEYVGSPIWALDTFRFSMQDGKDIFQDGAQVASDDVLEALVSNTGTTLGHFRAYGNLYWFQGDLAEVIVYDRALATDERLRIEAELAARYGRSLSVEDYVPCDVNWRNHGQYVSNLTKAAKVLASVGLLSQSERAEEVVNAARSDCGT